jgi:16S rRNA (adenine1518-N6/adenine1519-N6)-dimethyltransferase
MRPKKRLGQHFLTAPSYAKKIAASIDARPYDHVLEIGPGRGALSVHLKKLFPGFHCVELDQDMVLQLSAKLGPGDWVVHQCDALKFDFSEAGFPLHVVGNLPYSVGAMIIKKTLFYGENIVSCTFMVQREVAQRIASPPHSTGFYRYFASFSAVPVFYFMCPREFFFQNPELIRRFFSFVCAKT